MPVLPLVSLIEVARSHQILRNLWSVTGTAEVISKLDPPKQVVEAPYDIDLRHHAFFESKMTEHPAYKRGQIAEVIRWALDKDHRTRSQTMTLGNEEGYTWGKALDRSQKPLAVLRTVTEDSSRPAQEQP